MKNYLFLFIMLLTLLGCQSNESVTPSHLQGKWQLSSYEITPWAWEIDKEKIYQAESLDYEMYYEFASNGRFKKWLSTGVQTGGTYSTQYINGTYHVDLHYQTESEADEQSLQFSCTHGKLALQVIGNNQLEEDDRACDGAKWVYNKIR